MKEHGSEKTGREPVEVQNSDILLLADVYAIMQEIQQIEQLRKWQQSRMDGISQHLTWTPASGGSGKRMEDAFARLSEIDEEHEERCKEYAEQIREAQAVLDGIQSENMRAFVVMKYVMNVQDAVIRKELNMTRYGFNQARQNIESASSMKEVKWQERYILSRNEEEEK